MEPPQKGAWSGLGGASSDSCLRFKPFLPTSLAQLAAHLLFISSPLFYQIVSRAAEELQQQLR